MTAPVVDKDVPAEIPVSELSITATGTPVTPKTPRDAKGRVIEPRPSTPVPDEPTHKKQIPPFILVDTAGEVVGIADDLRDAQPLADDIALALYPQAISTTATPALAAPQEPKYLSPGVTVYQKVSHHAARVFTEAELAEKTAEGPTLVSVKQARAKLVLDRATKDVADHLELLGGAPSEDVSEARSVREKELKAMTAEEVRVLAQKAGVEAATKAENIENLLDAEF